MDAKLLRALSELQARSGGGRGIQWEVYVQPVRPAWWLQRHLSFTYPLHLPQLLSGQRPMAIHGHSLSEGGVTSITRAQPHSRSPPFTPTPRPFSPRSTKASNMPPNNF